MFGLVLYQRGRQDRAVAYLQQGAGDRPTRRRPRPCPGAAQELRGPLEGEAAGSRRALLCQPQHAQAYKHLAIAYARQGRLDAALGSLERALQLTPGDTGIYYNRGVLLQTQGRLVAAAECFQKVVAARPNHVERTSRAWATSFSTWDGWTTRCASYRQTLRLDPDQPGFHANLGIVLLEQGRIEEALACYDRAVASSRRAPCFTGTGRWCCCLPATWRRGWPEFEWRLEYELSPSSSPFRRVALGRLVPCGVA